MVSCRRGEILAPYDFNIMPVRVATDIIRIGDSIVVLGQNMMAIYTDSTWHTVTEHDVSSLQKIIPYPFGDGYLICEWLFAHLDGRHGWWLIYWDGDSLYEEFENNLDIYWRRRHI
jgi:hypothetical protein